jgi:hypothetical protein
MATKKRPKKGIRMSTAKRLTEAVRAMFKEENTEHEEENLLGIDEGLRNIRITDVYNALCELEAELHPRLAKRAWYIRWDHAVTFESEEIDDGITPHSRNGWRESRCSVLLAPGPRAAAAKFKKLTGTEAQEVRRMPPSFDGYEPNIRDVARRAWVYCATCGHSMSGGRCDFDPEDGEVPCADREAGNAGPYRDYNENPHTDGLRVFCGPLCQAGWRSEWETQDPAADKSTTPGAPR